MNLILRIKTRFKSSRVEIDIYDSRWPKLAIFLEKAMDARFSDACESHIPF